MVWSTRSSGRDKEYVVIKHRLSDMNGIIGGVKFRAGYAVVEKGSKLYRMLQQLPLIKNQPEYPLLHLRKLKFVTRAADIRMIFGQDVYYHYIKALKSFQEDESAKKVEEVASLVKQAEIENKPAPVLVPRCFYVLASGKQCEHTQLDVSPSKYCRLHLLKDPKLKELGIEVPSFKKGEQRRINDEIIAKLQELSKN